MSKKRDAAQTAEEPTQETTDSMPSAKNMRKETSLIVTHCTATPRDMDIGVSEIDGWHKDRGWDGCGYHKVIRRCGAIEDGRDIGAIGAHAYGYNRVSIGIALVGGVDDVGNATNNFTSPQLVSWKGLVEEFQLTYPDAKLVGHRDLSPDIDGDGVIDKWEWKKACPSFDAAEMFAAIS
jgi:N-acetylmuramoyl-L-alanine amidase